MNKYLIILLVALSACDVRVERVSTPPEVASITINYQPKTCYELNDDAARISSELNRQGVTHSFNEEEKCIYSEKMSPVTMTNVENIVFGAKPPAGLSQSSSKGNEESLRILEANGIAVKIWVYRGNEYISWGYKDHEKAEELLGYEPWKKEMMKEFRGDSELTPNNHSQSDAKSVRLL